MVHGFIVKRSKNDDELSGKSYRESSNDFPYFCFTRQSKYYHVSCCFTSPIFCPLFIAIAFLSFLHFRLFVTHTQVNCVLYSISSILTLICICTCLLYKNVRKKLPHFYNSSLYTPHHTTPYFPCILLNIYFGLSRR